MISGGKANTFLKHMQIEDLLTKIEDSKYYEVCPVDLTIEETLNKFHNNPKLLVILLTKTGGYNENAVGIVTGADSITMNKVLDDFN